MQLSKLTTRYVAEEDRFLVSAESDKGNINLWLTQRLILSLIPHLLNWLDANTSQHLDQAERTATAEGSSPPEATKPQEGVPPQVASQLVSQTRRMVSRVDAGKANRSVLVQTLHLQPRGEMLKLVFQLTDEEAILLLQPEHLRIWLGAFYNGWQNARWPDIWPEWMKQAHKIRRQYPVSTMH